MRVEKAIHGFLTQLAENMEAAMHSEEFFEKLEAELNGKTDEDSMKLKQALAKKKRTAKQHEKAGKK